MRGLYHAHFFPFDAATVHRLASPLFRRHFIHFDQDTPLADDVPSHIDGESRPGVARCQAILPPIL